MQEKMLDKIHTIKLNLEHSLFTPFISISSTFSNFMISSLPTTLASFWLETTLLGKFIEVAYSHL